MTDSIDEEESSSGNHELEPKAPRTGGPWDPLASYRKTISPTQRMELLQMKVPVLPPEDFMDTADFQRAQRARSRRFLPLVFALGAFLLVLLFMGLWSRFLSTPPQRDSSNRATPVHTEQPPVAVVSSAAQTSASPLHTADAVPPTLTAHAAPVEAPPTTKPAAKAPSDVAPSSPSEPNPRSPSRSAVAQPKTSTPPVLDPAPSNTLWTKPR
jgi:cytoskeletal protein RodZ